MNERLVVDFHENAFLQKQSLVCFHTAPSFKLDVSDVCAQYSNVFVNCETIHRSLNQVSPNFLWQTMLFNQIKFSSFFNKRTITQTLVHMLFTTVHIISVSFKKLQFGTVYKDDILYKR